jgi:hypothetical protein
MALLQEVGEPLKHFGPEGDGYASAAQAEEMHIELTIAKAVDH